MEKDLQKAADSAPIARMSQQIYPEGIVDIVAFHYKVSFEQAKKWIINAGKRLAET